MFDIKMKYLKVMISARRAAFQIQLDKTLLPFLISPQSHFGAMPINKYQEELCSIANLYSITYGKLKFAMLHTFFQLVSRY